MELLKGGEGRKPAILMVRSGNLEHKDDLRGEF